MVYTGAKHSRSLPEASLVVASFASFADIVGRVVGFSCHSYKIKVEVELEEQMSI